MNIKLPLYYVDSAEFFFKIQQVNDNISDSSIKDDKTYKIHFDNNQANIYLSIQPSIILYSIYDRLISVPKLDSNKSILERTIYQVYKTTKYLIDLETFEVVTFTHKGFNSNKFIMLNLFTLVTDNIEYILNITTFNKFSNEYQNIFCNIENQDLTNYNINNDLAIQNYLYNYLKPEFHRYIIYINDNLVFENLIELFNKINYSYKTITKDNQIVFIRCYFDNYYVDFKYNFLINPLNKNVYYTYIGNSGGQIKDYLLDSKTIIKYRFETEEFNSHDLTSITNHCVTTCMLRSLILLDNIMHYHTNYGINAHKYKSISDLTKNITPSFMNPYYFLYFRLV